MARFYTDWKEAHTAAVHLARELGREVGLERGKEFNRPGYLLHHLPRPENRTGFELRCEIVRPSDPL